VADSRLQQPWGLGWDLVHIPGPQQLSPPGGCPSKGGRLTLQCTFSVPSCALCSPPHLPVHRGSDLLVCRQLQGVHHSQDLIKVSPSGGWVQDGEFQLLIRAKNEHLSGRREGQGRAADVCRSALMDLLGPAAPPFPRTRPAWPHIGWTAEVPLRGSSRARSDAQAQGTWCLPWQLLFPVPACFAT